MQACEEPSAFVPDLSEHRRKPRIPQELNARLMHADARAADSRARILDLSPLGLGLITTAGAAVGEDLGFNIQLPKGGRVLGKARVRWASPNRAATALGLEIVRIGVLSSLRLQRHLAPQRFWPLNALDQALRSAVVLMFLTVAWDFFGYRLAGRDTFLELIPWGLIVLGPVVGLYMLFRYQD